MSDADRIALVEATLRAAGLGARAAGITLVKGAYELTKYNDSPYAKEPVVVCRCIVAAHDLAGGETLGCADEEWDAIEHGWDGDRFFAERDGLPMSYFELGARLAAEFSPMAASTLSGT
jgi:hypothetical protein